MKNKPWVILLAAFLLLIGGLHIFAFDADRVDHYYVHGLYPHLSSGLISLSHLLPFSLFEWVAYSLVFLLLFMAGRCTVQWLRKRITFGSAVWACFLRLCVVAAGVYLWFLTAWGLNYYRIPLMDKLGLAALQAQEEHFVVVSRWATKEMARLYRPDDKDGVETATEEVLKALDEILDRIGEKAPKDEAPLKNLLWNYPLDATGTRGFISPLTLEVHLSKHLFPEEIPFLAAHETAHIRGYGSESEANLLAFEACLASGNNLARFSAFFCTVGYLYSALEEQERIALFTKWPEGVKDLRRRIKEREERYAGFIRDWSGRIYDLYLKSRGVQEGIKSYSKVGTWIVLYHHEEAVETVEKELEARGDGTGR